jgi:hypothetical protein
MSYLDPSHLRYTYRSHIKKQADLQKGQPVCPYTLHIDALIVVAELLLYSDASFDLSWPFNFRVNLHVSAYYAQFPAAAPEDIRLNVCAISHTNLCHTLRLPVPHEGNLFMSRNRRLHNL